VACGLVWLVVPAVRAGLKARCALRPWPRPSRPAVGCHRLRRPRGRLRRLCQGRKRAGRCPRLRSRGVPCLRRSACRRVIPLPC